MEFKPMRLTIPATTEQVEDLTRMINDYLNGKVSPTTGLCQYFLLNKRVHSDHWFDLDIVQNACIEWDKFSGYTLFPIKGSHQAYYEHHKEGTLHIGEQGDLRIELCNRMLVELSKVTIITNEE